MTKPGRRVVSLKTQITPARFFRLPRLTQSQTSRKKAQQNGRLSTLVTTLSASEQRVMDNTPSLKALAICLARPLP